jgi:HPt (histidine-containing phosphotransfer) domain-containing protein
MSHPADPQEHQDSAIGDSSSDDEVLDRKVLQELVESLTQPATVAALYRKFIGNADSFIRELHIQEDAARLDTLHTLKGSAAMMGARRIAQLAMHWQTQLQSSPVQLARATDELAGELAKFRVAAAAHVRAIGASLDE